MADDDGKKEETHVLMVAFAAQGHLNPMLRLAKHLTSKGLQVTLATTEVARQRMFTSTTMSSSDDTHIHLEFFSDGLSIDYDRKTNLDYYMDCLGKFGPQNLSTLIHNFSEDGGRRFSCIINNPFVPWVANVAVQHGIPCAMLWIQPCSLYAIYYRFYNQLNTFPMSDNLGATIKLPGLPLLHYQDLPSFILPANPFGSFPKLFSEMFKNMDKVKWVLGNSYYELEKEAVESMAKVCPIMPVGPLVPSVLLGDEETDDVGIDMWKPDETCINWLDKKPDCSVVYVSLGSIAVLSREQMEGLAMGLKNSNRSFLWVVKPPDYSANNGAGQLPTGFLEDIEGQGIVVKWCPQTKVLLHPAISCFITHCGWNSTLETVAAGVPVISFPQWSDQPTNSKLITDVFRAGIRFKVDEHGVVSKEEVQRCIDEIMDGPAADEFKKRGLELKEAARKAVMEGGSSHCNIQSFIKDIRGG